MTTVTLDNFTLTTNEYGDGEIVLFVHGSASDARSWQGQVDFFRERARVVTYSRRYHHPNPPPGPTTVYDMRTHVDDLAALIAALGDKPLRLVGHSYGAYVALMYALREPRNIARLVLAEPPVIPLFTGFPPSAAGFANTLFTRPLLAFAIARFLAFGLRPAVAAVSKDDQAAAIAHFTRAVLGRSRARALTPARQEQVRANFSKAELLSDRVFEPLDAQALSNLQLPVLLVTGARSPALFRRLSDGLADLLPSSVRIMIPGASHDMHEAAPAAFNPSVAAFLGV